MLRSVDVDVVDVDGHKYVVGVVGLTAPHGVQVEDLKLFATFPPTDFAIRTFVLVVLGLNISWTFAKIILNF